MHGGGQERDIRSGTLDPPAIAGLAAAIEASPSRPSPSTPSAWPRCATTWSAGWSRWCPTPTCTAPRWTRDGGGRLPGNAHLGFPGCEGDSLLMLLDARGIECSTGSACSAGVPQPSHVLLAMGCDADQARHSLRFSLGHTSTAADVDAVVEAIGPVVERARAARPR